MTAIHQRPAPVRVRDAGGSDFAVLSRRVKEANLLDRRRGSYSIRIAATVFAYLAVWTVFVLVGNSWLQLITAAVLGVVFTQVAFLGHDSGHHQVWRSHRANDLLTILAGDLLVGLSFSWWVDKHNRHHSHPNHEGQDPDIGDGVLAFTANQIATRHGGIGRFIGRHQAWLFFPLLTLEGLHLHVSSAAYLLRSRRGRAGRYRVLEIAALGIHIVAATTVVLLVLDPVRALAFVVVQQAVFGLYMGCSFAPNHKGMPTIPAGRKVDFLRRQVLTSRNVRGNWMVDLLLGGLNYQVEHHLFPNMPRASLRHARIIVRAHCAAHGITYTETSLFGSYRIVLRHLHSLGAPLRRRAPALG